MNLYPLYPLKLRPVLKDIIWGGTKLASNYGKSSDPNQKIAESWELAVHKNGVNVIENGEYAGSTLEALFKADEFPLLVKLIDAAQNLSVQVHPGDKYAAKHENDSGKTEMWYIIDANPGAKIVYGLNDRYTRKQLQTLIDENRFEECLNYIEVSPGEVYFIPAGLVHAIGAGILIAEIQTNSDTTYRFYDYNRPGADNKPRELHIKKALDVCIKTKTDYINPIASPAPGHEILSICEYFYAEKLRNLSCDFDTVSMRCIICIEGEGKITHEDKIYIAKKGETYLLPAGIGWCTVTGKATFIIVGAEPG